MIWPLDVLFGQRHPPGPSAAAIEARQQAAEGLQHELSRSAEVSRVADSLRKAQLRNHFSEAMDHLLVIRGKAGESH
jgi:hypothetical protein